MPVPQIIVAPTATTAQLAEAVMEIQRILTRRLGIGDPAKGDALVRRTAPAPTRPASTLGLVDNLYGSLVELTLLEADLGTNVRVAHNLGQPAPPPRATRDQKLNVRWLVVGTRYLTDNFAADLPVALDHRVLVLYADGAVSEDEIELRFYTDLTMTAAANNRRLVVSLFVFPASG